MTLKSRILKRERLDNHLSYFSDCSTEYRKEEFVMIDKEERKYKILMATAIPDLDKGIIKADGCELLKISHTKDELQEDVKTMQPQIVIVSDLLSGNDSLPDLLIQLKKEVRFTRFIYLAGKLDPRDSNRMDELGRMVLGGIYDIYTSNEIDMEGIESLIKNPIKEEAVSFLAKNILNNSSDEYVKEDFLMQDLPSEKYFAGTMDNVFVFTSIKPGTGKTFLSVNTACAIAAYGKPKSDGSKPSVALVEADLQTLSIGTILNIKEDKKKTLRSAMAAIATIFDKGNMIGDKESIELVDRIILDCMQPYKDYENFKVLTGSTLTPEEISALQITPEYYIYLLDVLRKNFDIVIVDTNSSMFHVTTYPILQIASKCFYIMNLDVNNVRNNLRYYGTLRKLGLTRKIKWILNENIENTSEYKNQGIDKEKLTFTADDFEKRYFKLSARIPSILKSIFLNRNQNGTPIILDEGISYTVNVQEALIGLARQVWPVEKDTNVKKKNGGFFAKFFRR